MVRLSCALPQGADQQSVGPLPPHLEPNPIAGAFSPPSPFQKFCVALLSWFLLATAGAGVVILSRKMAARSREVEKPRIVTVLFENPGDEELSTPLPSEPGIRGEAHSEEPNESVAYFDPRAIAHPELAKEPIPSSMDIPLTPNLLPTRPVIYSGGSAQGTPGVVGFGGSGTHTSSHVARWGDGALISGDRRGLTVEVDNLAVLHQEIPKYPTAAREAKIAGEVVVDVVIDEKGIPIEVVIVRSDHILLTPTVMAVAPKWRFTPVLFGGKRVRANFRVCFRFILEVV